MVQPIEYFCGESARRFIRLAALWFVIKNTRNAAMGNRAKIFKARHCPSSICNIIFWNISCPAFFSPPPSFLPLSA